MKLAANLNTLWRELPYLDRFEAAADAGFEGVAVPFPYDLPAKETYRAALRNGLALVQISAPPPNYTGGERGFAALVGREERFRYDLRRALRYCEVLKVPLLQVMVGAASGEDAWRCLVENLTYGCAQAPAGMRLLLQPQADEAAFLNDFDRAVSVIEAVGAENLALQFPAAHAQQLCGDAVAALERYAPYIGQIMLADAPAGGAPGTREIDLERFFAVAQARCPKVWITADYDTQGATGDTLHWLAEVARG